MSHKNPTSSSVPIPDPFTTHPWSHLLTAPSTTVLAPPSLTPKPLTHEDSLFATTLRTPTSITSALCFHPTPPSSLTGLSSLNLLVHIGHGMNGWPGVLHGGMVATLIDEAMGTLLVVDGDLRRGGSASEATGAFTVDLRVEFKRPVVVPGVVLVRCEVLRREGRKIGMRARCLQEAGDGKEEDRGKGGKEGGGELVECASGEALFVVPRGVKL